MKPTTATLDSRASNPASRAIRNVVGTRERIARSGCEHVARASNSVQERLFEPVVQLAAEPADVDVDDVGARIEVIVPDLLEQHGAGYDPPFVASEIFEKQILSRLEVQLLAVALHRARERIDFEIADREAVIRRIYARFAPAQQGVHAGQQVGEGTRLHQIIVGTSFE